MELKYLLPHQVHDAIQRDVPLLVPAGCVECHGAHAVLGLDTIVAEAVCRVVAGRRPAVVAPAVEYGPTGWAVSGPELGTVDVDGNHFYLYVKDVLRSFLLMGWPRIFVVVHHQGMDGPEALAFRKAASDLTFEMMRQAHGPGWWGYHPPETYGRVWERVRVMPTILPAAAPGIPGDHAGRTETSLLMHLHPGMVDLGQLAQRRFWYTDMPGDLASEATAELGRQYFEAMVEAWVQMLDQA